MRFWFFLYCFVLADDILSFWVYVEKYLEFFTSLSWCVCLQLNVIFSTNMWTMLTELFHASVCWAVKNVKFSVQLLSEPDFWVFRLQLCAKELLCDENLERYLVKQGSLFSCKCLSYVHITFTKQKTWDQSFPHAQYFSFAHQPRDGVSRFQQPIATSWRRHPPCCGG